MSLQTVKNLKEGLLVTQGTSGKRKACAKSRERVGTSWELMSGAGQ